ncbi:MAG: rod shape-determining protein MreC [Desulfobacterales bacterium]|nr:rod shape-determining protein MreC [Desulfobacterales bacterium]
MKLARGFRRNWIWILSIAFVLFLLSLNSGPKQKWYPAEQVILEIAAPFQKLIGYTVNTIRDIWLGYFNLVDAHQENKLLKMELDAIRMENSRYRELLATYERLQGLNQFKQTISKGVQVARVTGLDPTGWFKSIIIDKGKSDGLRLNMPVVHARGVVGRVVAVSPNYAKVLLIIDQNSAVDCLVQRSRAKGMVRGLSTEICRLDYVLESSDVIVGDIIVTSGLGGVFPKGLPVGHVLDIKGISGGLFKNIEIRPAVDFSKIEEILVILKEDISPGHMKQTE